MHSDKWLENEISAGLAGLAVLQIRNAPSAQNMPACITAWCHALTFNRHWHADAEDAERIRAAFRQLAVTNEWWPAPAEFLRVLPARKPAPALPAPTLSEDERAHNKARIAAMLRTLTCGMAMEQRSGCDGEPQAATDTSTPSAVFKG